MRADELAGLRAAVEACTPADELDAGERLLGQISSLEAGALDADGDAELTFRPAPGTEALAARALEHLRAKPLRRRAPRRPARRG